MEFIETALKGAFIIVPEPIEDERGFFARAFCTRELEAHGLDTRVAQCNMSYNKKKGTLRGLHYQTSPHAEVKLMRCFRGSIYDVIIDLRPESPTFKAWTAVELTADNRRMIYIPERFAHGFQTLEDDTEVYYQVSASYRPECERGVRWDDPQFRIEWPVAEKTISLKDRCWPDFG